MDQASTKSFWTTVPGILAGVAAVITAIGGLYAVTRERRQAEPVEVAAPPPTGPTATPPSTEPAAQKLWQRNWLTVSQPRGFLGSGGQQWTNRDQLLAMLRALDIPQGDPLLAVREQLLTATLATAEDLSNGPHWSLPYSPQMKHMEEEPKRGIRDRAIEHGVAVDSRN